MLSMVSWKAEFIKIIFKAFLLIIMSMHVQICDFFVFLVEYQHTFVIRKAWLTLMKWIRKQRDNLLL